MGPGRGSRSIITRRNTRDVKRGDELSKMLSKVPVGVEVKGLGPK